MKTFKFTHGPWIQKPGLIGDTVIINGGTEENKVCILVSAADHVELAANVDLILAAEQLLSACLMAREELIFGGDWHNAKRIIDEAINEALKQ